MTSIDEIYKKEYSSILAILVSRFGLKSKQKIEDSIQEAFVSLLLQGKLQVTNTKSWIIKVAANKFIDSLRRENKYHEDGETILVDQIADSNTVDQDDDLQQLFLIAKQDITEVDKAILSLYFVIELEVKIISGLFFKDEKAVYQRILRAKNVVKSNNHFQEIPDQEKPKYLNSVLKVLYLIFTAGYNDLEGNKISQLSLCYEALRIATILSNEPLTNTSETRSLIALMLFQASRLDARVGINREILTLEQQDFSKWNKTLIEIGLYYLDQSENFVLSEYKLLSHIAASYSTSKSFKEIDWNSILKLYDILISLFHNPVYKLNRLVVVEKVSGANRALEELQKLKEMKPLFNDYQLHLLEATFFETLGKKAMAKLSLLNALKYANTKAVKDFIQVKLNILEKL